MKTLERKSVNSYISLQLKRKQSIWVSMFLSVTMMSFSISCSYYNVRDVATTQEEISNSFNTFNQDEKYAVLHAGDLQWHISNVVINQDDRTIEGRLQTVSEEHQFKGKVLVNRSKTWKDKKTGRGTKSIDTLTKTLSTRDSKRVHRYKREKSTPLNEVHFYLNNSNAYQDNQKVSISFSDVSRISVNDKNTGRSIANVVAGYVGTVAFVTLLIVALKSSCPFIYIKNGESFDFAGELYPGTITANMQKDDYLPLPNFKSENNEYILKIANYLKEVQYTDCVQLVLFNHEGNTEVLLDSKGEPQTFKNIISPSDVLLDEGFKSKEPALKKDNNFYAFNTSVKTDNSSRHITFEFDKPNNTAEAKLYLTAKNSVWLDYIFGKFNEQFGMYYNTFQKKQQDVPKDNVKDWTEGQNIPLSVYLKTNKGWELVEKINTVGPMAMRDLVVPLKLEGINEDKIQIKLETGFMFWEVDYVGMDFSENIDLKPEYISPSKAIDHVGNDVTESLLTQDNNYLIQPNIGDEVTVSFSVEKPKLLLSQSIFLKNRGYYNYIRDYNGIPDFEKLKSFRKENTFTRFSEKAYFDYVNFDANELTYHE